MRHLKKILPKIMVILLLCASSALIALGGIGMIANVQSASVIFAVGLISMSVIITMLIIHCVSFPRAI